MSEAKNKENQNKEKVDDELSELLESALEDFSKEPDSSKNSKTADDAKKTETTKTENEPAENAEALEWSEDFIRQAASQFESNFANMFGGGGNDIQMTPELLQQKLQQMSDAAQQVLSNPTQQVPDQSVDFASTISQTIQGLNAGAEGLQTPFSEDDLMKLFGGGGQTGQENDFVPFMQGMMQGLLSKEILGPSLQDYVDRFPAYIESNRDKLSAEDVQRYESQKQLMVDVLAELNKEKDTDTPQEKTDRFSKVLELMQKLHDYGQPPSELVGDIDTPFNFDAQGNPAGMNPDCSIM